MSNRTGLIIAVIVLLVIAGGALAILGQSHNAAKPSSAASGAASQTAPASTMVLVTKSNSSLGQYFTEPDGTPLYTYSKDSSNVSNCSGTCLANWPAYQDTGATKNLPDDVGTIKRTDNGQVQFTYYGMPLYTFIGDKTGQVTGNGVAGFVVAKPVKDTAPSTSSTMRSSAPDTPYTSTD